MNYKKKIKLRMFATIGFVVMGIAIMIVEAVYGFGSTMRRYGIAACSYWIVMAWRYRKVLQDEEMLREWEIRENDERNIMIEQKAGRLAIMIYVVLSYVAVLVLELMGLSDQAGLVAVPACVLGAIWLICRTIIRKCS